MFDTPVKECYPASKRTRRSFVRFTLEEVRIQDSGQASSQLRTRNPGQRVRGNEKWELQAKMGQMEEKKKNEVFGCERFAGAIRGWRTVRSSVQDE